MITFFKQAFITQSIKHLKYLPLMLCFLTIPLKSDAAPSQADVAKAVSQKFKGMQLETLEMEDYFSDPLFDFYNAAGTVKSTENMYAKLDNSGVNDFPILYKQVIKANELFPFTTVLAVVENDNETLIDLQKSRFIFPYYHNLESELDLTQQNLILVDTPDGMARLTQIRAPYEKDLTRIEEIKQLILAQEKQRTDTRQQGYDFWSTVEIDGQKFNSEKQVTSYFVKKINSFKNDNSPVKFRSQYNKEVFKPKEQEIYNRVKTHSKEYYAEIKAQRDAVFDAYKTDYDLKLAALIDERDQKLKQLRDEERSFGETARNMGQDIDALKQEKDTLERKTDGYVKLIETAVHKGFIEN
ncbi:hypothetical protein [Thorsellia anophelis]|uniref:Uncharacterized protein n=1 Tax=Thorsellia anophelis DSM 18579 TaxID=1123402 RepID=A0A1I0C9A7_9GAMM|nr:hypothetical protein [Thorsellia anophelis]SET15961.1 hypothetical protein SAMN02583745_01526 [Thorsellia anophelis DSM 18579]